MVAAKSDGLWISSREAGIGQLPRTGAPVLALSQVPEPSPLEMVGGGSAHGALH